MNNVQINRELNLVITVDAEFGTVYVHSTPIAREVFEKYYLVLTKVYNSIVGDGIFISGHRIASLRLRDIAKTTVREIDPGQVGPAQITYWWEGADGIENGLLNEIRRITNVILPSANNGGGWTTEPWVNAAQRLDPEDVSFIESTLVFFTWPFADPRGRVERRTSVERWATSIGFQTSLLNCTAYAASLPISTATANSGETGRTSSATISHGSPMNTLRNSSNVSG